MPTGPPGAYLTPRRSAPHPRAQRRPPRPAAALSGHQPQRPDALPLREAALAPPPRRRPDACRAGERHPSARGRRGSSAAALGPHPPGPGAHLRRRAGRRAPARGGRRQPAWRCPLRAASAAALRRRLRACTGAGGGVGAAGPRLPRGRSCRAPPRSAPSPPRGWRQPARLPQPARQREVLGNVGGGGRAREGSSAAGSPRPRPAVEAPRRHAPAAPRPAPPLSLIGRCLQPGSARSCTFPEQTFLPLHDPFSSLFKFPFPPPSEFNRISEQGPSLRVAPRSPAPQRSAAFRTPSAPAPPSALGPRSAEAPAERQHPGPGCLLPQLVVLREAITAWKKEIHLLCVFPL